MFFLWLIWFYLEILHSTWNMSNWAWNVTSPFLQLIMGILFSFVAAFTWQTGEANSDANIPADSLFQGPWKWKVTVPLPHPSDSIPGAHMDGYVDAVCPVYSVTTHDSAAAGPAAKCG